MNFLKYFTFHSLRFLSLRIQAQSGCAHPDIDSNIIHDISFGGKPITFHWGVLPS